MNEPSPEEQPSVRSSRRSRNWPLFVGIGLIGALGVAISAYLLSSLWQEPAAPPVVQAPTDIPPEADSPSETAAPADLREHQQIVGEVVSDLDRDVLVGNSPTRGNPEADVVLLEFSDFQCPYCAQASEEVETFISENETEVLFVYKHLPLTNIHPEALPAALAAWAAGQQEQFWAFHDALFANQEDLGDALYLNIAQELGLDLDQFNRDRESEAAQAAIARDLALASEMQLASTPTFVMNNLLIPGAVPADFFAEALIRLQSFQEETSGES